MNLIQRSYSMRRKLSLLAVLAIGLTTTISTQVSASPTLLVNGGVLDGVNGVNVDGTNYNVTFSLGSCATVFTDCSNASNFTFSDQSTAFDAFTALNTALSGVPVSPLYPNGILNYDFADNEGVFWLPYAISN